MVAPVPVGVPLSVESDVSARAPKNGLPQLYFKGNPLLLLDHLSGARALVFLLYGVLPASFAALGLIDTSKITQPPAWSLPTLLIVSLVPATVFFLLVRQRLDGWYLARWGLNARSVLFTLAAVGLSAAMSGEGAFLRQQSAASSSRAYVMAQSLLTGIGLLVGSSTLFLTVIQKSSGLPGLPSEEYTAAVAALRSKLRAINARAEWDQAQVQVQVQADDGLVTSVREAGTAAANLARLVSAGGPRRRFYENVATDLRTFLDALSNVSNAPSKWADYVGDGRTATSADRPYRDAIDRVRVLSRHA
jgi:hypothetical protein